MNVRIKKATNFLETLPRLKFAMKEVNDDFAYELHLGCFILSWDILNNWILFLNVGDYRWLADATPVVGKIESMGNRAIISLLYRIGVMVKRGQWNVEWLGRFSFYAVCRDGEGPASWEFGWLSRWLCPYCANPIKTPVWECHVEAHFCSEQCATRYVYGECQAETTV